VIAMTAERSIAAGVLVPVLPDWSSDAPPIYMLFARGNSQTLRVRKFVEFITGLFVDMPRVAAPARRWPMYQS